MADNYLEKQYEEYLARKEARKNKTKGAKSKTKSAVNDSRRSSMKEDYRD